jgi:hypothetical protein
VNREVRRGGQKILDRLRISGEKQAEILTERVADLKLVRAMG